MSEYRGPDPRPLCPCHGEAMDRNKGGHECAVRRRARQRAAYHRDPHAANYERVRHALRARIRAKKARLLEVDHLAEED